MKKEENKKKVERKREDILIRIVSVAFILSVVIGFFLLFKVMDQQETIRHLIRQRFDWCNAFNQLKNVTDGIIATHVNSSYPFPADIDCSPYRPFD